MPLNLLHKAGFKFYNLGWSVALPWLRWNHRLAAGYHQRALKDKLPGVADLWIQAASIGESFLAIEILKTLQINEPTRILLTSNTRQGIDIFNQALSQGMGEGNPIQTSVRYFPFDKPSIMAAAVAAIRPKLLVLLETEIWPGLLLAIQRQHSKSMIVNGRVTEKSLKRYLLWPSIWQNLRPDKVLAISVADADRFRRLFGSDGVDLMHNIKFDRMVPSITNNDNLKQIQAVLPGGYQFIVCASVRQEEESEVKKLVRKIAQDRPQAVIGLFPRHIQRLPFWQKALTQLDLQWVLRSEISTSVSSGTVILWDTFGELMPAFRLSQSAFIGGSLAPLGGQNFLEALVNGVIPVIGPSWENFAWVGQEIIEAGLLKVADDWQQVAAIIRQEINAARPRDAVIEDAYQFFKSRQGGTARACRQIEAMLVEDW